MQITIRMPDRQYEQISRIAEKMGLKKSDITRLAIKQFVEAHELDNGETPYGKTRHLLGIAESSKNDFKEFCGVWQDKDLKEFEERTSDTRRVDPADWK